MENEVKILRGGIFPSDAAKLETLHKNETVLSNKEVEQILKTINNCSDDLRC